MSGWRIFDSLFVRLMFTQLLLVLGLSVVFGSLFYLERTRTMSRLLAERWAPGLREAAGFNDIAGLTALPPKGLQRMLRRPSRAVTASSVAPTIVALRDAFEELQIPVGEMAYTYSETGPVMWLEITLPNRPPVWLGLPDRVFSPEATVRMLLLFGFAGLMMVCLSGYAIRQLTRPLERLRQRLAWGPPPDTVQNESYLDLPLANATPDVEDIDRAWRDVQTQLARHGRERAFLLAGLSHDLRHPLARIKLTADLLPSTPELITKRAVILRNTEMAERMVASFLDHARSGGLPIDQSVDLAPIARRLADERPRSTEALHVDVPASLRLPRSHPILMDRLMSLLVENAYTHGRPPLELRARDHLGNIVIEVIDSGPLGSSGDREERDEREEREQSLIAFAAGENIINLPRIGLGLAVVREIVVRMRGRIEFERGVSRHIVRVRLPGRRAVPPVRPSQAGSTEDVGETLPPSASMF